MAEKKMSTGEVAGHLRAASRIFKAFEFAEEIAVVVLTAESSVRKLEKEIVSLKKEKESLNKECDEVVARSTAAEQSVKKHNAAVAEAAKLASTAATAKLAAVKAEADVIVARAKDVAKEVSKKTRQAMVKQEAAESAQRHAESELDAIASRVAQAKESFLKAFG